MRYLAAISRMFAFPVLVGIGYLYYEGRRVLGPYIPHVLRTVFVLAMIFIAVVYMPTWSAFGCGMFTIGVIWGSYFFGALDTHRYYTSLPDPHVIELASALDRERTKN